jgi:hypothetical protein
MADDDRPKKSWREIDSSRDKKSSREPRRDPEERGRARVEKSAAYGKYKAQLDKLFTPGSGAALPESMRAKLGPTSEGSAEKKKLGDALRDKADGPSLKAYLDAGLELPEDARLLIRLLDVTDAALVEPVLSALLAIVEGGQKPSRMLLIQKLDALILRFGSGSAVDKARDIRAALD